LNKNKKIPTEETFSFTDTEKNPEDEQPPQKPEAQVIEHTTVV
jgi:hypothetical protein